MAMQVEEVGNYFPINSFKISFLKIIRALGVYISPVIIMMKKPFRL
jgi:hypothetical protein